MTSSSPLARVAAAVILSIPSMAGAQTVLLQIKPRLGDTLAVRVEQLVEMNGAPMDCTDGSARKSGRDVPRRLPCSAASRQMKTLTQVFSRAIITGTVRDGVLVRAITDSIRSASSRGSTVGTPRRVLGRDRSMDLRVGVDGGAEVVDSDASDELRALFGQMPAMLSKKPVAVGASWKREMRMPVAGETGAMGLVRATFRLDSLGRNGDIAYISMRGTLSHDHRDGSDSEVDGFMKGTIELDRRLAWITETRAEITVTSIVRTSPGAPRMRVRTHITQLLEAARAR